MFEISELALISHVIRQIAALTRLSSFLLPPAHLPPPSAGDVFFCSFFGFFWARVRRADWARFVVDRVQW